MVHHMQRLVALMQVVHVVCNGQPQQTAPLPVCPPGEAWPLEVVEGQQVEVTQLTEVLHSSPSIVLAEPSPARLNTGVVVALAPLLGGQMYPDPGNERWLHVWVRPSVRGLLKAWHQAASKRGGLLYSLRTLADGHWVLQFQDGDRLTYAVELAKVELARLLSVYKEQLGAAVNDVFNLLL
ncbi:FPL domain-containing protein [Haematococcus lacustris]|uniref:FPL domain-containing protein n=1 Tax=Haematococcus lacustris TaxID=44745 RepID=A0A699Z144_HAELA|nr:FPL domain-containing protein [Haematococcus lacustris]